MKVSTEKILWKCNYFYCITKCKHWKPIGASHRIYKMFCSLLFLVCLVWSSPEKVNKN